MTFVSFSSVYEKIRRVILYRMGSITGGFFLKQRDDFKLIVLLTVNECLGNKHCEHAFQINSNLIKECQYVFAFKIIFSTTVTIE